MKKLFFILIVFLTLSCDDGNIDISGFEFEEKVNVCQDGPKYTLYRLSDNGHKEALIVTLTEDQIKNSEDQVLPVKVTPGGPYLVSDRVFDDEVTSDYFCSIIPPAKPVVVRDYVGLSGNILVENNPVYDDNGVLIAYEHMIVLNDVVLESNGEKIIFNDTYLFGIFETSVTSN